MSRDSIRSAIFSTKAARKVITVFGQSVEIRQMTTEQVLKMQEASDRKVAMLSSIVNHCFVPGTNEPIFDETDYEALLEVPFTSDMVKLSQEIGALSDIDISLEQAEGNSEETSTDEAS